MTESLLGKRPVFFLLGSAIVAGHESSPFWSPNSTSLRFFNNLGGFTGGSFGKESACKTGDLGSIPGLGRSPGGVMATHSSSLAWRIPRDRGAWCAAVHWVAESDTTERLSTHTIIFYRPQHHFSRAHKDPLKGDPAKDHI